MSNEDHKLFENMRSMISLVDKLRDFNLHEYISLPRIAVLGEQSAGKSSLLESIAGITFLPRGTGIVTRRPLELRMIRSNVEQPYFMFPDDYGEKKFLEPENVTQTIIELTDKVSGSGKQITKEPIICRVYSNSVPDLTLVDLPGVTRNPVGDQPQNIEEITKGLVTEYCSQQDTVILCVIPANIDLANSDAIKLATKLDPTGQRTLGVLTKVDLMDEGTDCSKVLLNQEIKLKHGYIGVKGRSQADIQRGIKMADAIKKELDFFGKHPIYSTLPTNLVGTLSLIDKLSKLLYQMIHKSLPRIRNEINKRLQSVKKSLNSLGEQLPELDDDKMELVFKLVREFKERFTQDLYGRYYHNNKVKQHGRETLTYQINITFSMLFEEYMSKSFKISAHYTDADIQKSIDVYQGENIPGFQSFDAFLNLINPKLELIGQPIFQALEECKILLEEKGLEIIDEVFKNYHTLSMNVKDFYQKILLKRKKATLKIIQNIVKCEENYLFTNDYLIMRPQAITGKNLSFQEIRILELRQKLDHYFFILIRNLRETIPKIIGKFLIINLNANIQVDILNDLAQINYCLKSLVDNKKNLTERDKFKQEFQALSKAENLLVNDFGMGINVLPEIGDINKNAQELLDDDGHVIDDEIVKNIDKINEGFLNHNQKIIDDEKMRIMAELGISPQMLQQLKNQRHHTEVQGQQKPNTHRQIQMDNNHTILHITSLKINFKHKEQMKKVIDQVKIQIIPDQ